MAGNRDQAVQKSVDVQEETSQKIPDDPKVVQSENQNRMTTEN